jgi:Peptidyl-tRNA hydrolase PTH2
MTEVDEHAVRGWRHHWRTQQWDQRAPRDELEPWALPLVLRKERSGPAADRQHALYAAALAMVRLLAHPAGSPEGPWHDPLERWMDGRIRKVVRRARGIRWTEVGALPGVTATVIDTDVRALLPHPVAAAPPEVRKLQVEGIELDADVERALASFPPVVPESVPVLAIVMAPGLDMSTGKACAQVGHAAQLGLLQLEELLVLAWMAADFPLRVVEATRDQWAWLLGAGGGAGGVGGEVDLAVVQDAGYTEVEPGTMTCAATFASLETG